MNDRKTENPILLVEDNRDDELLALRGLRLGNLLNEVVVARDGEEALDYLFGRGAHEGKPLNPALVLLDLKLPKINGIEVLRCVREDPSTKRIPVVVLTTSDEAQDMAACYDLCCNSYIRKPVDFKQFTEVVSQLKLYWLVVNDPPPDSKK